MKKIILRWMAFIMGVVFLNAPYLTAAEISGLAKVIFEAPAWDYYAYEKEADLEVIKSIGFLAEFNTQECRVVVAELMEMPDRNPTRNKWFKIMIINRLIFNVPDQSKRKELGLSMAGWMQPFVKDCDKMLLLWPLSVKDGCFRIASRSGGYSGADYDGLKEFDVFAAKFPRREKNGKTARNW